MELDLIPDACTTDDARLVTLGLQGSRDAFAELVARYQSPLCAMAYSACGNLSDSQDLAQETFIIAWSKLSDLDEPAKFKSWLYGIARNLLHNSSRRQRRNPLSGSGPLDDNLATPGANPTEQTITNEEEAILWRSLEQIPATYREPLVLFYREQQSVQRVAGILDLSEEVTRQRLSRGRKLLQEQVIAFVEGTLARTAPSQAFTLSVVSALPRFTAASGASILAASSIKGGAAKSAFIVALGAVMKAALFKCVPPITNSWITIIKMPESPRERKFAIQAYAWLWAGAILFPVALMLCIHAWGRYWDAHPRALTLVILGSAFGFTAIAALYAFWLAFTQRRIREEEARKSGNTHSRGQPYEYRSPVTLLGLPLIHIRFNCVVAGKRLPAIGWIAMGDKAFGILVAMGGIAVGGFSFGGLAIGLIALGGVGIGLFAFGGLSIGGIVMGGAALGYVAMGGGAVSWLAASGGAVVSRHFAVGGGAIAPHANDAAARAFMRGSYFFSHEYAIFDILILFSWLVPPMLTLHYKRRRERASRLQPPKPNPPMSHPLPLILALSLALLSSVIGEPVADRITVTVKGSGPDVILIPGLASSGAVWDGIVSHLGGHYRLHIVQLAGFAGSPPGANATGPIIQPTVDAIDTYITANHLKSPKVIGHSLGGLIGLMLALKHPDDLGGLMIVDSLPFFGATFGAPDATAAGPRAAGMRDTILAESQDAYAQGEKTFLPSLVKSPSGLKSVIRWAIASDKSVVARALYEDATTDLRPSLHAIQTQVTILYPWDASSGMPQAAVDAFYQQNFAPLPHKELIRMDGSFHFIMLDQPDAFASEVDAFLK